MMGKWKGPARGSGSVQCQQNWPQETQPMALPWLSLYPAESCGGFEKYGRVGEI